MNKMNLPPPFEELEAEFPMLKEVYNVEKYKDIFGNKIIYKCIKFKGKQVLNKQYFFLCRYIT